MRELAGGDTVLSSGPKGERHRRRIEEAARDARVVILDFTGIETVTPSYFRGAIWFLWSEADRYPILSGMPAVNFEDIELFLWRVQGLIWAGVWSQGDLHDINLLGPVESIDAEVLQWTLSQGQVSAVDLEQKMGSLSLTGWNNRLSALWKQRVLRRTKSSRRYIYHLPWRNQNG